MNTSSKELPANPTEAVSAGKDKICRIHSENQPNFSAYIKQNSLDQIFLQETDNPDPKLDRNPFLQQWLSWLEINGIAMPEQQDAADFLAGISSQDSISPRKRIALGNTLGQFHAWLASKQIYPDLHIEEITGRTVPVTPEMLEKILMKAFSTAVPEDRFLPVFLLTSLYDLHFNEIASLSASSLLQQEDAVYLKADPNRYPIKLCKIAGNLLLDYRNRIYPDGFEQNDPLFPSQSRNSVGKPMNSRFFSTIIAERLKKYGIDNVDPRQFRASLRIAFGFSAPQKLEEINEEAMPIRRKMYYFSW